MNLMFMLLLKVKDHKQYEFGNKVSIASSKERNIIVGVVSHGKNIHDLKIPATLVKNMR